MIAKGKILLSSPFLDDMHFRRSVIYLVEHNQEGSLGFIINKALAIQLQEVIHGFQNFNQQLSYGGPVENDGLFFLHRNSDLEDATAVGEDIYWGGDFEALRTSLDAFILLEQNIRFLIGYAGWSAGQLEAEIQQESWLVCDLDPDTDILDIEACQDLWSTLMRQMPSKYAIWANHPNNPSLN